MTQTDTQTPSNGAAAGDNAASTSSNGGKGSEDLDAILKSFEAETSKSTAPNSANVVKAISALRDEIKPVRDYVDADVTAKAEARFKEDVSTAVKAVKADNTYIDDFLVEGFLRARSANDPAFDEAWNNRHKSPDVWNSALERAKEDFSSKVKPLAPTQTDSKPRNDLEAAAAAVRNISTEPPKIEPLDTVAAVHNWNDQKWAEYKRQYYREQQKAAAK